MSATETDKWVIFFGIERVLQRYKEQNCSFWLFFSIAQILRCCDLGFRIRLRTGGRSWSGTGHTIWGAGSIWYTHLSSTDSWGQYLCNFADERVQTDDDFFVKVFACLSAEFEWRSSGSFLALGTTGTIFSASSFTFGLNLQHPIITRFEPCEYAILNHHFY